MPATLQTMAYIGEVPWHRQGTEVQAVRFRAAAELTPQALAATTDQVRIRVLRWFARSGLIEPDDVREMIAWENSGFSLVAAVFVVANDLAGLERLPRPCVRLLHVRFIEHCCRSQPKRRCPLVAESCRRDERGLTASSRLRSQSNSGGEIRQSRCELF